MRVLLDENLPRKLKRHFDEGVEAVTVRDCGWTGIQNGELLQQCDHTTSRSEDSVGKYK